MVDVPAETPAQHPGFATQLRSATAALHLRAERTGIVAALLRGQGQKAGYALLLRNLLPAYRAIEDGLLRHRTDPRLAPFAGAESFRSAALAADLATLNGDDWAQQLALLPAGSRYALRVAQAAEGSGDALVAHVYVRVLGDLSGGQTLARVLQRTLDLAPAALSFYRSAATSDLAAAKAGFRAALDAAGPRLASPQAVLREAQIAFRLNIALSEAVLAAATASG